MKKESKEMIRSVVVLALIAAVCVAILAVANEFLRYTPVLDRKTADMLAEIVPADGNPMESFELCSMDDTIKAVNKKYGSGENKKVLAVYKTLNGASKGAIIVQSQAKGNDGAVVMLTAIKDGAILGIKCYSQGESYWAKVDESSFSSVKGQTGEIDPSLIVATGATNSKKAIVEAVNLAVKTAREIGTEADNE